MSDETPPRERPISLYPNESTEERVARLLAHLVGVPETLGADGASIPGRKGIGPLLREHLVHDAERDTVVDERLAALEAGHKEILSKLDDLAAQMRLMGDALKVRAAVVPTPIVFPVVGWKFSPWEFIALLAVLGLIGLGALYSASQPWRERIIERTVEVAARRLPAPAPARDGGAP